MEEENKDNKSLFRDKYFIRCLFWPIFIGATIIISFSFIELCRINFEISDKLNFDGLNSFYNLIKLPLGIMAISIPLSGLYAAHFRSIQTEEQIKEIRKQNIISNYFRYLEKFSEIKEKYRTKNNIKITFDLKDIFPDLIKNKLDTSEYINNIKNIYNNLKNRIKIKEIFICSLYNDQKHIKININNLMVYRLYDDGDSKRLSTTGIINIVNEISKYLTGDIIIEREINKIDTLEKFYEILSQKIYKKEDIESIKNDLENLIENYYSDFFNEKKPENLDDFYIEEQILYTKKYIQNDDFLQLETDEIKKEFNSKVEKYRKDKEIFNT